MPHKVTIDKDHTTIVEGGGHTEAIQGRVKQLRAQVEDTTSDYDREKLRERLAKLVGGVKIARAGPFTGFHVVEKPCGYGGSIESNSVVRHPIREAQLPQALTLVERRMDPQV